MRDDPWKCRDNPLWLSLLGIGTGASDRHGGLSLQTLYLQDFHAGFFNNPSLVGFDPRRAPDHGLTERVICGCDKLGFYISSRLDSPLAPEQRNPWSTPTRGGGKSACLNSSISGIW